MLEGEQSLAWACGACCAGGVLTCMRFCLQPQLDEPVGNTGVAHLAALRQLTRLSLAGRAAVTADGLAFLGSCTRLRSLDLSHTQLSSPAFLVQALFKLTQLTSLDVSNSQVQLRAVLRGCHQFVAP